jgi:serine/threonine protein kinase
MLESMLVSGRTMPPQGPAPAPPGSPDSSPSVASPRDPRLLTQRMRAAVLPTPATPMMPAASVAPAAPSAFAVQYPVVGSYLRSPRGDYAVTSVLGSGEFGAVYECIGPFDQVYALKMIRPAHRPYADVQQEWARESQRLLSLRHPNVVYIYDHFSQDHLFYLALERCDHSLAEMLGTPLQEGLVIELARQLLAAVQFLHENDVVHDDLHAGNVLLTHTDRPVVKITDFGISQNLRGAFGIRPNVVHHTIMAPEILANGYTSKQSDLYQIGLLLFWMVTGVSAIPDGIAYDDLMRFVAEGAPRRRAEAVGTPFGMLIAKMLRRREQYRYTSAREVWADLRKLPAWQNRELFPIK